MADDSPKSVLNGFLGHLPPWPRKALNNSVIGMEQAYRQRKGLPLLTDADIEALKADQPMLWESGDATSAPASAGSPPTQASTATAAAPASPAPAAATSAPSAGISEEVAKWVAAGNKWSKSTIAAEQARRGRKGLPALNGAEITALLGEPATPAAAAPTAPAAATAASAPRPAAAAATVTASAAASVARSGEPTRYVGTPAVGTSKAVAGAGLASVGPEDSVRKTMRSINNAGDWCGVLPLFWPRGFLAFFRFFLPRTLFDRLFVIYARCTHLGCTPDWKPSENKFECPCHGSGNFESPAPRPMDRAHIERSPDGQILVDVSRLYQWPKGQPSQLNDDGLSA